MEAMAFAYLAKPVPPTHSRSISYGPSSESTPPNPLSKARSTNDLSAMAATDVHDTSFKTLADPRNASTSDLSRAGSHSTNQPESNNEMSILSDKLVSAIEHNSALDERLAETMRELKASRARIDELEREAKGHEERLSRGDLLTKQSANELNSKLSSDLAEERRQKTLIQQEKRGIETELETLTASLFDEANKMVAAANQQREVTEKKNQQLRDQIKDGEAVIASQTEQLTELKALMQSINSEHRRELESPRVSLGPSSPGVGRAESDLARLLEAMNLSPTTPDNPEIIPSPSTNLTHLLKPSCRTDIPSYEDFRNLVQTSIVRSHNPSHAPSRAGSGSYGGLNVMGLGSLANGSQTNLHQPATSKLANSPSVPGSFNPNPDGKGPISLKDTKFFKRIMAEDVEPTLRLDLSPTISWLNRRSILSALTESTLIVEPISEASMKLYGKYTSCALCGESRKEGQNPRTHAMRVREGEGATKWSICQLCLEKVRGVGDLIAYVRMIREGVVKCGDRKEEEEAWEELIRMRERLFWARMAGGVVPSFLPSTKGSPVPADSRRGSEDKLASGEEERQFVKSPLGQEPTSGSGFHTPDQSRRGSVEASRDDVQEHAETASGTEAQQQLQQSANDGFTTFDPIKEQDMKRMSSNSNIAVTTPPVTPPTKNPQRNSGGGSAMGFPKISIPRIPDGFWQNQVNTLH